MIEEFVKENLLTYNIETVVGDGNCMLISFVIALKSVTGMKIAMPDIVKQLRKEMLTKYNFYRQFSSADVNILQELELFSDNPLVYYNSNIAALYLVALGNAYKVNIMIFQSNEQKCWICDLNSNEQSFSSTLHFARTLSPHVDPTVPITNVVDDIAHKSSCDEDIVFVKYVEGKEKLFFQQH